MAELRKQIILKQLVSEHEWIESVLPSIEKAFNQFLIENQYRIKEPYADREAKDEPIIDPESVNEEPGVRSAHPGISFQDEIPLENSSSISHSKSITKLYRHLCMHLHPDKHLDEPQKYHDAITSLNQLYESNDINAMINLAVEHEIDVTEFMDLKVDLDTEIKNLTETINLIKSRVYWKWFFETDPDKQREIIDIYFVKYS
jgi:hypothetical protein